MFFKCANVEFNDHLYYTNIPELPRNILEWTFAVSKYFLDTVLRYNGFYGNIKRAATTAGSSRTAQIP